ncbi:MAG: hypothetical protein HGA85_01915 [Nanoarchaeota archaeon]|nr:hypothetical protein [Nanoarchaeota archaeon]
MEKALALDIGGTNFRIAEVRLEKGLPVVIKKDIIPTKSIKNVSYVINKFSKDTEVACIGFAGPIIGSHAKLTNESLEVDIEQLKKETRLTKIKLINDFHAVGYGISGIKKSELVCINKGAGFGNDVKMVVGPGTGLGKAYVIGSNVYPCEGGLTTLGIENIDDYAILDYLRSRYNGPVYYEDIVSGRGLIDIYNHLEIKSNLEVNFKIRSLILEEPVNKAKLITKYSSKDKLCDMTLRIFTKFYARFVRDSALNLISSEVYLVGGISEAIRPYLDKYFMEEFQRHRTYSSLLRKINVCVIANQDIGLLGAGAAALS